MKYQHIVRSVFNTPWAITSERLAIITDLIRFRASGGTLTAEEIQARVGAAVKPVARQSGSVAVLPLFGVISQRVNMMTDMSGGTSMDRFAAAFRGYLNDPNVKAIVLSVDSPGGSVYGVDEMSTEIFKARGQKPVMAIADSLAASAAYYIASAADEMWVTPSGEMGSVGVLAAHTDVSKMEEMMGLKTTLISAGKYKVEGNQFAPLDPEATEAIQKRVDEYYDLFVAAVARNRGVSARDVRNGYGEGRVVGAKEAVRLGMADRVGTMEDLMRKLGVPIMGSPMAESEPVLVEDCELVAPVAEVPDDRDRRERRLRLLAK